MLSAESLPALSLPSALLSRVRVWEVVGWSGVLAAAGVLRLAALADRPLGPDEAEPALAAWRLWMQHPPSDVGAGVLLLHALVISFGLLGASDLVARLPTVVAGLVLVGAPWLLRPALGAVATLATGALLALSPMLVFASRHVDPAILVPMLLALLVGVSAQAVMGYAGARAGEPSPQPSPRGRGSIVAGIGSIVAWQRWAYAVPVLLALLLTAGSVAVPATLAVLGAAAITWWPAGRRGPARGSGVGGQGLGDGGPGPGDEASEAGEAARGRLGRLPRLGDWLGAPPLHLLDWRLAGGLFAATLVLVGSLAFTDLRGLQGALVEPWVSWLAPYYPRTTPIPWLPTLLVYDLPIVVAAIAGIVLVIRRNQPVEHFLLWWTTLAAVPLVFQPPDPLPYLVCWLLPLALLGGLAAASLVSPAWTWRAVGEDALVAAIVAITFVFAVNTLRLVASSLGAPGGLGARGRELAFSIVILAFLVYLHARLADWWRGGEALRLPRIAGLIALTCGLAFVVVTNGRLQFAGYGPGGPELLRPDALAPGVYDVAEELQTWARQEPNSAIVVAEALRPLLVWHLRDVPTARFQHEFPDALRTPPGQVRRGLWPAGPGAPEGERQPLRETIAIGPILSTGVVWNWWLYRNAWLVPTRHDIIVVR